MLTPARTNRLPGRTSQQEYQPFTTAEEAWFWTMQALIARREGARIVAGAGLTARPCEPDDVVKCLDRLYRQRRIDLQHARILRMRCTRFPWTPICRRRDRSDDVQHEEI
jgi:hypothetical protein